MYGSTSVYLTYIIVLSATCPYICDLCNKTLNDIFCLDHMKAQIVESVHVAVKCVMKLLVCKFYCTDINTFIVINVNSSEVSAINHLLNRLK